MPSKPWYASHAIWGAVALALFGVLQLIVAVGSAVSAACASGADGCVWEALGSLSAGTWALTIAGLATGIGIAVARWKAGEDDSNTTTARLTGGKAPSIPPAASVLLALGAALAVGACSGPPLTAPQAQAGAHTLGLSCDIVRELVNPDVLPVSPEEAALADRICAGAEVVGGVVFAGLSRPLLGAPRVGAPAEEDQAPQVPAWALASRCARPGLSPGARDACAVLMAAAQDGRDLTVVAQASAEAAP